MFIIQLIIPTDNWSLSSWLQLKLWSWLNNNIASCIMIIILKLILYGFKAWHNFKKNPHYDSENGPGIQASWILTIMIYPVSPPLYTLYSAVVD